MKYDRYENLEITKQQELVNKMKKTTFFGRENAIEYSSSKRNFYLTFYLMLGKSYCSFNMK